MFIKLEYIQSINNKGITIKCKFVIFTKMRAKDKEILRLLSSQRYPK